MRRYGLGARVVAGTLVVVAALLAGPLLTDGDPSRALAQDAGGDSPSWNPGSIRSFAKYDGVDGESSDANHGKWIRIRDVQWGAARPRTKRGVVRRRGAAVVEDVTLTIEFEKSTPKLQEKCLRGEVIPKLEIEQTANYGGSRATYLKYTLKNVIITSYNVHAHGSGERPQVVVGNNFEEVKVTYTEYDSDGGSKGNVEYEWKVEKGR